jgi:hypothetical protein
LERIFAKARAHDSLAALARLTETDDHRTRLASRPPLLVPVHELWAAADAERVAQGIRLVLAGYRASLREDRRALPDIFLGWSADPDGNDYYVRQLWDMKGGIDPAKLTPGGLGVYGGLCGWTLARAHGRSGDEVAIAAYLGKSDAFDDAVATFAVTYADVNDRDHQTLAAAVEAGKLQAVNDL